MLAIEYLSMMYYILRLADAVSFNRIFGMIEDFLDISKNEDGVQISSIGGDTPETQSTSYLESKALIHVIANLILTGIFTVFVLIFINRLYTIKSFD